MARPVKDKYLTSEVLNRVFDEDELVLLTKEQVKAFEIESSQQFLILLANDILLQQKITNIHLAQLSGLEIDQDDVEEDR